MGTGIYEEELPSGGKLQVSATWWEISYYFPGPDYRYKGDFVTVPGNLVDEYILAFKENWTEYEKLKAIIPEGGEFSKKGRMGMTVGIGGITEGVCLHSYHMPIRSVETLEKVINDYLYAAKRAVQIQSFLVSL